MCAKFLDHQKGDRPESITQADVDNKMMAGTRGDQRDDDIKRDPSDPARNQRDTRPRLPTSQKVLTLASNLGVDLAHVTPTGENGTQITEEDVRKASEDPNKKMPSEAQINDLTGRRDREKQRDQRGQPNRGAPANPSNPGAPANPKGQSTPTGGGGNPTT